MLLLAQCGNRNKTSMFFSCKFRRFPNKRGSALIWLGMYLKKEKILNSSNNSNNINASLLSFLMFFISLMTFFYCLKDSGKNGYVIIM